MVGSTLQRPPHLVIICGMNQCLTVIAGLSLLASASLADTASELVVQLGAKAFDTREHAQAQLADMGEAARSSLQKVSESEDPEVAVRARQLLGNLGKLMVQLPPAEEGHVKSDAAIQKHIEIQFVNMKSSPLKLFWLDLYGKRKFHKDIPAKTTVVQDTIAGHLWLVADPEEDGLAIYTAAEDGRAILKSK